MKRTGQKWSWIRWLTSRAVCGTIGALLLVGSLASLVAKAGSGSSQQQRGQEQHQQGHVDETWVVILLQPSPVDVGNQVKRLSHIDAQSWGLWLKQSREVAVYAGLLPAALVGLGRFDLIKVIPLPPPPAELGPKKTGEAAYPQMVHMLLQVLLQQPSLRWLLFANDHTFLVPPNLACFLDTLQQDVPVYSGSSLQRGMYRDVKLRFASGGAGAVLSHVSLKLLLLTWAVTGSKRVAELLDGLGATNRAACPLAPAGDGDGDRETMGMSSLSRDAMLCALLRVRQWSLQDVPPLESRVLVVAVSPQVTLTVSRARGTLSALYQRAPAEAERGIVPIVRTLSAADLAKCDAASAWDRVNPGLVVAYCLQHVFGASFSPSVDAAGAERFNVFGSLRTLGGDVDPWLTECKLDLPPGSLDKDPQERARLQQPLAISRDLVSFHYVSHAEATLLFRALAGRALSQSQGPLPAANLSAQALVAAWPQTDAEVGAYSRRLRGEAEARRLVDFLGGVRVGQC